MGVSGKVDDVRHSSWGDHVSPSWEVLTFPGFSCGWTKSGWLAFQTPRIDAEPPLVAGDAVVIPVRTADGHVDAVRANGTRLRLKMLGGA